MRIEYDRENCIGAFACLAVHPDLWKKNDSDNKADLEGGKESSGKWVREIECSEDEKEKIVSSAEVCPVRVIKIIDTETGAVLVQ
ncbi:MAG: ferredoxin [Candidatus Diapherotrites archaeon]|nr:ferredoxin [Candidatus Diapherotrites archaeon]